MRLPLLAVLAALCLPLAAHAQVATGNGSTTLSGATVKQIFKDATDAASATYGAARRHWRVCNMNAAGAASAALSWFNSNPGPNAAGSYMLAPQSCEEFNALGFVPQTPLWAVPDASGGNVALTAEVF